METLTKTVHVHKGMLQNSHFLLEGTFIKKNLWFVFQNHHRSPKDECVAPSSVTDVKNNVCRKE